MAKMVDKFKTLVALFFACTILILIFLNNGFLQNPVSSSWHLLQEPFKTLKGSGSSQNKSRNLNFQVSVQDEEPLEFVKQNVEKIFNNTRKLLDPYIIDIVKAAKELKSKNKEWKNHGATKQYFNAYTAGYFKSVQKLPSVRTIIAKAKFSDVLEVLNTKHYHYGSSDCISMEKKGIYGQGWGKTAFNSVCQSDVSRYNDSKPVQPNYFTVGLPEGFSLKYPDVALTFMHVVSSATVSNKGDVFVDQTKLLIQRCSQSKSIVGKPDPRYLPLHDEVFTIAQFWGTGFFHFTAENLVRIGPYIKFLKENKHIKVHVVEENGFVKKWLRTLGISSERIVNGNIRATILYMPAGGTCGRPAYFVSNMLSINLRQSFGLTKGPRDTVVVIKRSHLRFFRQHDRIWKMVKDVAEPLGFQVCLFSDEPVPSVEDTKEMFQRAVLIVGPHGAGLSNMFLSQPGTVILEGLCIPMNLCYRNMAEMLGHRYMGLVFDKSCFDLTPDDIKPYLEYFLQHIVIHR